MAQSKDQDETSLGRPGFGGTQGGPGAQKEVSPTAVGLDRTVPATLRVAHQAARRLREGLCQSPRPFCRAADWWTPAATRVPNSTCLNLSPQRSRSLRSTDYSLVFLQVPITMPISGCGSSSVVENLPTVREAPGSILPAAKEKKKIFALYLAPGSLPERTDKWVE